MFAGHNKRRRLRVLLNKREPTLDFKHAESCGHSVAIETAARHSCNRDLMLAPFRSPDYRRASAAACWARYIAICPLKQAGCELPNPPVEPNRADTAASILASEMRRSVHSQFPADSSAFVPG